MPLIAKAFVVVWTLVCLAGVAVHLRNFESSLKLVRSTINRLGVEPLSFKTMDLIAYLFALGLWLLVWNLFVVPAALVGILFGNH